MQKFQEFFFDLQEFLPGKVSYSEVCSRQRHVFEAELLSWRKRENGNFCSRLSVSLKSVSFRNVWIKIALIKISNSFRIRPWIWIWIEIRICGPNLIKKEQFKFPINSYEINSTEQDFWANTYSFGIKIWSKESKTPDDILL